MEENTENTVIKISADNPDDTFYPSINMTEKQRKEVEDMLVHAFAKFCIAYIKDEYNI